MSAGLRQAEVAGGKRVKFLAWALFQTAVLGNWLRNSNVPLLRSLLSWPRSLLSRELGKELGKGLTGRMLYGVGSWSAGRLLCIAQPHCCCPQQSGPTSAAGELATRMCTGIRCE